MNSEYFFNLLNSIHKFPPLVFYFKYTLINLSLKDSYSPKSSAKARYILNKIHQKHLDLINHKTYFFCFVSMQMQTGYSKNLIYPGPHTRKYDVPSLLFTVQICVPVPSQDPPKLTMLALFLLGRLLIMDLARKYDLFLFLYKVDIMNWRLLAKRFLVDFYIFYGKK